MERRLFILSMAALAAGCDKSSKTAKKRRTVITSAVSNKKWDEQVASAFFASLTLK